MTLVWLAGWDFSFRFPPARRVFCLIGRMMTKIQDIVYAVTVKRLSGKQLWWSKRVRIFCDGGRPIFRWFPRYCKRGYHPHWGMRGFAIYWLGREFNFSFGSDRNGFYER